MDEFKKCGKCSLFFKWIPVFLTILWGAGCYPSHQNSLLCGLFLKGFEQAGPLVVYNRANIFDYIDGEAEVYLPLGFRLLFTQRYQKQETAVLIIVETYDMGTIEGAKTVFARYTQGGGSGIHGIGESAWTDNYLVLFRKSNYFFRILPDPSLESEVKPGLQDMLSLSKAIDRALRESELSSLRSSL